MANGLKASSCHPLSLVEQVIFHVTNVTYIPLNVVLLRRDSRIVLLESLFPTLYRVCKEEDSVNADLVNSLTTKGIQKYCFEFEQ